MHLEILSLPFFHSHTFPLPRECVWGLGMPWTLPNMFLLSCPNFDHNPKLRVGTKVMKSEMEMWSSGWVNNMWPMEPTH